MRYCRRCEALLLPGNKQPWGYNGNPQRSGQITAKYNYDAWGKLLSVTDANGNVLPKTHFAYKISVRYRGYEYDSETGLYYLQSRYYDPETGRFINADDANFIGYSGEDISYNAFAYCDNNPVNKADYLGYNAVLLPIYTAYSAMYQMLYLLGLVGAAGGAAATISINPVGLAVSALILVTGCGIVYVHFHNKKVVQTSIALIESASTAATPPPPNKGGRGTKVDSKTLYNKNGNRIDVENPGNRQGQIHLQRSGDSNKYVYNVKDKSFHINKSNGKLAPKSVQNLLSDEKVINAIAKGLTILGY